MNQHCVSWDDIPEEVSASGVAKRVLPGADGTWSETPAWFRTKLFVAPDASIALSFSDVSDAHQFFTSPLRSSNDLDYRANSPHGRNTDIGYR